jgi:hypothetical protein
MKNIIQLFFVYLALFIGLLSCKNSPSKEQKATTNIADSFAIINVHAIITNDVNNVIQTPYAIKQSIISNKKIIADSIIPLSIFKQLANCILSLAIKPSNLKNNYTESVFKDNTTNSITINYATKNTALPIKNIDILLNETGQTPKHIFIKEIISKNDTLITNNYSWKLNKSFQINNAKSFNNTIYTLQTIVNWNDY